MSVALKRKLSNSPDGKAILVKTILTAALTVPTAPTTALSGDAGICTDGAHTVAITYYTEQGETTIGASGTARTTATANNGRILLTNIPCDPMGLAVGRKIYMSKAGTTTPLYYVATIADIVTTSYAVNVADANLNVVSPAVNLAYSTRLQAPTVPTTALVTTGAGSCTNGTHVVAISYVTADGETAVGVISTPALTVDSSHNKILVTNIPVDPTGQATGRNVYMSKAGTTWPLYLVAASPVVADNATGTYTIDVADASLTVPSVANGTVPTLIHTAVAGQTAGTYDEIWLWAYNHHTADVVLTLEFGGNIGPDNLITQTIPFKKGVFLIIPGLLLQNTLKVRACAGTANVVTIMGFVNAIVDS